MEKGIKKILKKPSSLFMTLGHREFFNWMNDKKYLQIAYHIAMGEKLDLENPRKFTEKLQWLKLYDRKDEYTVMVDKYEAKEYISKKLGKEYIIPTLGVWENFDDIDFEELPNQFVLKCTHDSGGLVVVKDKTKLDMNAARKKITKCLKHSFYWGEREWPYKNVKPRIIAEQYMEDESGELRDYKFFTFNGQAKAMFIATERSNEKEETKFDFFDMNFEHLPFMNGYPNSKHEIKKPECFDEMKALAEKIGEGIPHVRVDFYEVDGKVYFGEMTFFHWSGLVPFEPVEWDYKFGSWIKLPNKK